MAKKYPTQPISEASKDNNPIFTDDGWVIWDSQWKVWLVSDPYGGYYTCADNGMYEAEPSYFWTHEQVYLALNEEY